MAYIALYRKYRPRRFCDMVGQDHITRVLKKQLQSGQTAHAYLFCGARGTGKTSAAKILARAVNCLAPVDGEPCGKCAVCTMGDESLSADIMEIDAASNNGVDEIRDLRDKISFAPTVCRYKVYIIDEVHMLSVGAFNALLKTLEEPPAHAKFILATTESGKIPATILSRCQRFDFKRIPTPEIESRLREVLGDLGLAYEADAVTAIAQAAEGGMRDALSILDQCVSLGGEKLLYRHVVETIGSMDLGTMDTLIGHLQKGSVDSALKMIETAYMDGKDLAMVLRDLTTAFCGRMVQASQNKQPVEFYLRAIAVLSEAETAMRFSQRPRTALMAAIARIALVVRDDSMEGLKARIARLEAAVQSGAIVVKQEREAPAEDYPIPEEAPPPMEDLPPWELEPAIPKAMEGEKPGAKKPSAEKPARAEPAAPKKPGQGKYAAYLEAVRKKSPMVYHALSFGTLGEEGEKHLVICFDEKGKVMEQTLRHPMNMRIVEDALKEVYGEGSTIAFTDGLRGMQDDLPPLVKKVQSLFGTDVTITD